MGRGTRLRSGQRRSPAALLRAVHVPLPQWRRPPGPRAQLHLRRPQRPLAHHAGPLRAEPHRLRQLRPAGRERRHQDGHPPPPLHRGPDRRAAELAAPAGRGLRLAAGGAQPRPHVHALQPGHLPALPGGGPGLPQEGAGQLVPGVRHRTGQRAGAGGRDMRAQRRPGGKEGPGAVVLPHHLLRRRTAGRPGRPGLAGPGQDHAAQLDRPLAGRPVRDGHRRYGRAHRGLHHPPRHRFRHDLRGPGARAPPGRADRGPRPPRSRGCFRRARPPGARVRTAVLRGLAGQAGHLHRRLRHQPLQQRGGPRLPGRLRADGLRHRRHHGRARRGPA